MAKPFYDTVPTLGKTVKIPWEEVGHCVGYGALGAALLYGFGPGQRGAGVISLVVSVLYAVTDEIHQIFTPGRDASIGDFLIDLGAAGIAILLYEMLRSRGGKDQFVSKK